MRRVLVASLLALALLGVAAAPATAADALGPFCLVFAPLDEFPITIFVLPNGTQFLLSGSGLWETGPVSFSGSAFVNGNNLVFSLLSANIGSEGGQALAFTGSINLNTSLGTGSCSRIGEPEGLCGDGVALLYGVAPGDCS
jgi:hypothetical protein